MEAGLRLPRCKLTHDAGGFEATTSTWGHSSAGRAPAWHAGGQEFESPWLHSSNPFHRKGSRGSRKAPFFLPARRKGQAQGQVEGNRGFLALFCAANRDPLLDPREVSQGQRPMPLKGKKGKSRASANPHRTGGRQRTQSRFSIVVQASIALCRSIRRSVIGTGGLGGAQP